MTLFSSVSRCAAVAGALLAMSIAAGCEMYPWQEKPAAPSTFSQPFTPIDAVAQNAKLGRGVNVLGYDPVWTDPAKGRFEPRHFKIIRDGGFKTVRVVLQSFDHMDGSNQLDPEWLATLDTMVTTAVGDGLTVILDDKAMTVDELAEYAEHAEGAQP